MRKDAILPRFKCKHLRINLRIKQARKHTRDPPWLWNPGQTSPELENRGVSGPIKGILSSKKNFFFKKERIKKKIISEPSLRAPPPPTKFLDPLLVCFSLILQKTVSLFWIISQRPSQCSVLWRYVVQRNVAVRNDVTPYVVLFSVKKTLFNGKTVSIPGNLLPFTSYA